MILAYLQYELLDQHHENVTSLLEKIENLHISQDLIPNDLKSNLSDLHAKVLALIDDKVQLS
jgi:hypothetical protein